MNKYGEASSFRKKVDKVLRKNYLAMSANTTKSLTLQWNQLIPDAITYSRTSPPLAARLIIEYRNADGANPHGTLHTGSWSGYTCYVPKNTWDKLNDPDYWQPSRIEDTHFVGCFTTKEQEIE